VLGLRRVEIGSAEGAIVAVVEAYEAAEGAAETEAEGMRPLSAIGGDPVLGARRHWLDDDLELAVIE
jgi:hypothetical protein